MKVVPAEYRLPQDLARVIQAWPRLPAEAKARILALVDAAQAGWETVVVPGPGC